MYNKVECYKKKFGVLVFDIRIWYLAYPTNRSKVFNSPGILEPGARRVGWGQILTAQLSPISTRGRSCPPYSAP